MPIDEHESECERLAEIKKHKLKGFHHDTRMLQRYNRSGEEVADAFEYLAPVIDTDQAIKFLLDLLQSKGAAILSETVDRDLWENEAKLLEAHQADATTYCQCQRSWSS